jgi:NtrC-family two-component system sensor histidine kinase KinB
VIADPICANLPDPRFLRAPLGFFPGSAVTDSGVSMKFRSLQTRFLVAGCLLVIITITGGIWSVVMFARLSAAVGETLRESQATIDLTASLSDTLEREDDALLLALSGKVRNARSEVAQQRQDFDESYGRLVTLLTESDERNAGQALREHADAYRVAGDALLARSVGLNALRDSQEIIDLSAKLGNALEREDDALLLALSGKQAEAQSEVARQRRDFDQAYTGLRPNLSDQEQQKAAQVLREDADAYRKAGDDLLTNAGKPTARELYHQQVNPALRKAVAACARIREISFQSMHQVGLANESYHQQVNPALRKAVADCGRIRELNFRSMQEVGVEAGHETKRSMAIGGGIALVALGLTTLVMVLLAQGVLRPVHELTRSVEAIRRDDFKARVGVESEDELGQLVQGFNRMAETLGDYRESSLGELLLAKATLEATLAALPDAIIVVDPDEQIVSKNPLAVQVLQAIGCKEAVRVENLPLPPAVLREVKETLGEGRVVVSKPGLSQALEVSLNGRPLKMLVTVVPIPQFLPRRAGAAIILADVTEFARLDELRGEVVAVASHELKTPLTSLQMNLLMLQEEANNFTKRQQDLLSAAIAGGEELAATIDELLDLTRIEAGQLQLAKQRVDLGGLVEQVGNTLHPRYQDAEVALRVVKEIPAAIVQGDPARLRIVLVNLLTNALKYTPRGGEVTVRLASRQNAGASGKSRLQITVTDTGPGIPPELRERIFEKFFRVEDHRPDGPKGVRGTGIGLYLCREIIEAHGGSISCETGEGGRGTRIAFTLDQEEG